MKKKIINFTLLILVGIMFMIFAVGSGDTTTGNGTLESGKNNLELVEVTSAYSSYSSYYIEGTIKNNSDKEYSYAQVTFNLYDANGSQIGTAFSNINNFEPNGTWKFQAIGLSPNGVVASYKLVEITGW